MGEKREQLELFGRASSAGKGARIVRLTENIFGSRATYREVDLDNLEEGKYHAAIGNSFFLMQRFGIGPVESVRNAYKAWCEGEHENAYLYIQKATA